MDVIDEANRLAAAGQREAAIALVRRATDEGDPNALFAMANWRLFGLHGPRDEVDAHRLLDRAREAGSVEAVLLKATLLGNGTGVTADRPAAETLLRQISDAEPRAAAQLGLLTRMQEAHTSLPAFDPLSVNPDIRAVPNLFSADECQYLMALAHSELGPSFVVDPSTGGHMPHPVRTSFGMNFDPTHEDLVVAALNDRLARLTGTTVECGEPLHILRYAPGQQYKPHLDAIPAAGNQRDWTVLIYLNEGYVGGETRFDLLDITFRGSTGDALVFRNVDTKGELDPRLRHAGLPVQAGIKWLATRWIRRDPYDPWTRSE